MRLGCLVLFLCGSGLLASSGLAADHSIIQGITLSTHTDGSDWGSKGVGSTMQDLRAVGANWVAIHPYARISKNGHVSFRKLEAGKLPRYLDHPIREARKHNLKVLLKPHLAYWGSGFAWRGDITFSNPEEWEEFFRSYEAWIVNLAAACPDVDGFVVGTELDQTLEYEEPWRQIVSAVRTKTNASLTYAANWTHYAEVPFWDALDVVGIQAYFPLADSSSVDRQGLQQSWKTWMLKLRKFSKANDRPILFTELGYNRSFSAPVKPWEYKVDGPPAEAMQALCLSVALESIQSETAVLGAFLWKWFPNPRPVGRNFQLATPQLKKAIRSVWLPATSH